MERFPVTSLLLILGRYWCLLVLLFRLWVLQVQVSTQYPNFFRDNDLYPRVTHTFTLPEPTAAYED
jgi:hypothetical protein